MTLGISVRTGAGAVVLLALSGSGWAQQPQPGTGTEEFGLSPRQLVEVVEKVEARISQCMRQEGFSYIAADYDTVRKGMSADKTLPGMSEAEFVAKYGFGLSTTYTGQPPQLATGYSPAKAGLGARNVEIFRNLSPADQVAYNRALFGESVGATFAVGLEQENFSYTGGCTRKSIEQVFPPEQVKSTFYNKKDALVNRDPRMKEALSRYGKEMRKAGFNYSHPDDVEPDIRQRLAALTNGGTILVERMSPSQQAALKELQDYERRVAALNFKMTKELIEPVEEKILEEMFARKPK